MKYTQEQIKAIKQIEVKLIQHAHTPGELHRIKETIKKELAPKRTFSSRLLKAMQQETDPRLEGLWL